MNAIIALCHFCELHGPSVMFCTQSFHDSDDPQTVLEDNPNAQVKKRYYGKPQISSRSQSSSEADKSSDPKPTTTKGKSAENCEGCKFIPEELSGYISNDHDAKVSYISSQYPFHPELFSIIRQACVRSISCENLPEREYPVFFGDEDRGYVYSHTFYLKDNLARGLKRLYSVIVVMMDKIFLLNSWPFLTTHVKILMEELQEKSNKVFETESRISPQRPARYSCINFPGDYRRPRGDVTPRPLHEITKDKNVFANMHLWFTWILKAGGNRMTEKLLEGQPTEDTVIDLEKQEVVFSETEEGFMLVETRIVPKEPAPNNAVTTVETKQEPTDPSLKIENIVHLWRLLGQETFTIVAYHVLMGNQLVVICDDKDLTTAIVYHIKILLPKGCVRDIPYSKDYVDSWRCNILGLNPTAVLPMHVKTSKLHIILVVENILGAGCRCRDPASYTYTVINNLEIPERGPVVYHKMLGILENEASFTINVVYEFFTAIKEEWMNKVKVFYKFLRTGNRSNEDTHKLLQVLGAHDRDKQVLKFWMTGLSLQFKNHVLNSTPLNAASQCIVNEMSKS